MIENKTARLLVETVEQAAKTPQRMLRMAMALFVELESPDSRVRERLDVVTQEMMDTISEARLGVEMTGCSKRASEELDPERKDYLASLLKGNPVSLNGRFSLDSEEDMQVADKFQEFLSTMDGVVIEEFDETMTRYVCVMPVNHPSLDLQFAVTRRELALSVEDQNLADLSGVYYGIAFGTVEK